MKSSYPLLAALLICWPAFPSSAQLAVRAQMLYPMTGDGTPVENGVVLCGPDGKIRQVGPAAEVTIPEGWEVIEAAVALPGLIDARTAAGMSGVLNWPRMDQEQFETSAPLQPELRALDAYNGRDPLVQFLRELGITTIHTGHSAGALISGQTMIVKTDIDTLTRPEHTLSPFFGIAATLGSAGFGEEKKPPGTRGKSMAMLRTELIRAHEYLDKLERAEPDKKPGRDLHFEALGAVLRKEVPLLVSADRHQDIAAALRLQSEFGFRLVLDSAAEAYLLLDEIKTAGIPVLVHPVMARAEGDRENLTFTLPAKLQEAGIPFAFQSGYESYVPKTRVVLFEAAMAVAHGLPRVKALEALTLGAAQILGVEGRIGSLAPGRDADLALYNGDPLETTTHCTAVIIDGKTVSTTPR